MQKLYKPIRIVIIFIIMAAMLTLFVSALYRIQIYETWLVADEYDLPPATVRTVTLPAARGNIYDRNGILLVSGRPSWNITLHHRTLERSGQLNETIQELIMSTMDAGIDYTDTFPITRGAPFSFVANMTNEQRRRLDAYLDFFNLDPEISAPDLLAWMRGHYRIDYTIGISAARLIIGVRYELEIRRIVGTITPYIFASDIDTGFASLIEERNLIGVNIESTFVREHHTIYAAHLLGYIGPIPQGRVEYFLYPERGYTLDALVGITGVEAAFEHHLRGISGEQVIRTTADGIVIEVETTREPIPGKHIFLSIDIEMQAAAEHALRTQIHTINTQREIEFADMDFTGAEEESVLELIPGGAVAVTDVNTGELLAVASYPTFNPATISQDIGVLIHDERLPLFNRAVNGRFIPGSTFKMVTGFAGLRHGIIAGRYFPFTCTGVFDRYVEMFDADPIHCWVFTAHRVGHGPLDIVQALEASCNVFFLNTSAFLDGGGISGAELLGEITAEFGLGVATGIELNESQGILSTPTSRLERSGLPEGVHFDMDAGIDARWWANDTVVTGFGQGDSRFTPIQLANFTATIANGGVLRDLTILRSIRNPDLTIYEERTPRVRHIIPEYDLLDMIREGMVQASIGPQGTARPVFGNYPIIVASKTGTAQVGGQDTNDGAFVAFAPAYNAEIAIALVVEKGGSGSAVMDISRMIFDHHFRTESAIITVPYGALVP